MSDDEQQRQQPDKPAKRQATRNRRAIQIDAPGFEGEVSEETAQTFLDYTGSAWVWVVLAIALSIVVLAVCLGLSWLI